MYTKFGCLFLASPFLAMTVEIVSAMFRDTKKNFERVRDRIFGLRKIASIKLKLKLLACLKGTKKNQKRANAREKKHENHNHIVEMHEYIP